MSALASAQGKEMDMVSHWGDNLFNANQSRLQRQFQKDMSNTAYQRAMADMRAAGLNPMLAFQQGGASTPGGASASAASYQAGFGDTAVQVARLMQDNRRVDNETALASAEVARKEAETQNLRDSNPNIIATFDEITARTIQALNSAAKVDAETPGAKAYSDLVAALGKSAIGFVKMVQEYVKSQQSTSSSPKLYDQVEHWFNQGVVDVLKASPNRSDKVWDLKKAAHDAADWLLSKFRTGNSAKQQ